MDKQTLEFCRKYEATIQPSHRKWRRVLNLKLWVDEQVSPAHHQNINYDDVPLAEIHMPTDKLSALIDLEDYKDRLQRNLMSPIHSSGLAYSMLKEYEEECRIRHTNPAVQNAYEKYRMLLELAR